MALPKTRQSKSNTHTRRACFKATAPELGKCPSCGKTRPLHKICPHCGFYNGRQFKARRRAKPEE
ncbi:MAG: 50S ribosomal protein L32 [bacterium]